MSKIWKKTIITCEHYFHDRAAVKGCWVPILWVLLLTGSTALAVPDLDLGQLKKNTQIFERIVGEILTQTFPNPFALTGQVEGSYVQGYGVVVSFHLNINRSRIRTPFGEIPARTEGPRSNAEQLNVLRESMVRCLADYGSAFKQLEAEERISINAHVEDRNELDATKKTTIVVISTSKQDLDLLTTEKISFEQFEDRIRVLQY